MNVPLKLCCIGILAALSAALPVRAADQQTVIVVIGAPGTPEYGADFIKSADAWANACKHASAHYVEIGRGPLASQPATAATPPHTDREILQQALAAETKNTQPLWIVLIGHGTSDGKESKFNLRDLDFSDTELATWLKPLNRPIAVIDCSSASATFLTHLSGSDRVVITATRAPSEVNYARFGIYMAAAIANPADDIDRDGQTSLLEAFLAASRATEDFYTSQGRLSTEHALLDDNGDGLGVAADWFEGTRATRSARTGAPVDGTRAHQWSLIPSVEEQSLTPEMRTQRNAVELQIEALRRKKTTMAEADYYTQLDALLLNLARLQLNRPASSAQNASAPK